LERARITGSILEEMKDASRVLILSSFSREEVEKPPFGGARLVAAQAAFFRGRGLETSVVGMEDFNSPMGLLMKVAGWVRKRRRENAGFLPFSDDEGERNMWRLNLLFPLMLEAISRIDLLARRQFVRMVGSGGKVLVVWNYPIGQCILAGIKAQEGGPEIRTFLYEHNVEGEFFYERLSSGRIFAFMTGILKRLELTNISRVERVICGSGKDRDTLQAAGVESGKLEVWIPRPQPAFRGSTTSEVPPGLRERLKGGYVVGFVGSDYGPNAMAVEHIMGMSGELDQEISFLVMGSVCKCFADREDIPDNVVLCGFVEDLGVYLRACDAFISPKTTSDTGIEMKMLDYMEEDKPVFSTVIGARGFEDYPGLIIAELDQMPMAINREAAARIHPPGGQGNRD